MSKYSLISIGSKFDKLTTTSQPTYVLRGTRKRWCVDCVCDCGNTTTSLCENLLDGSTKSCGCAKITRCLKFGQDNRKYDVNTIDSSIYNLWRRIKATGCEIYQPWLDDFILFHNWIIDFGWKDNVNKSLRRIDESRGFIPNNCCFVSKSDIAKENYIKGTIKREQTCLDKYGRTTYFGTEACVKYNTSIFQQKYNTTAYVLTDEFKSKSIETSFRHFGYSHPCKSRIIKDKREATCLAKYGYKYAIHSPVVQQKRLDTCMRKYGVPYVIKTNRKTENYIAGILQKFVNKPFRSDWTILGTQEIDIYNDELKLGIEYNGLRWHLDSKVGKNKHYHKYLECKKKGVRLLTIFSDEWISRRYQIENFIKGILGIAKYKTMARKCTISEIDWRLGRDFVEQYHIQGIKLKSLLSVGLYYQNELIGVCLFNKHHRGSGEFVLSRLVFKTDWCVVGGASKLISFGKKWGKERGFSKMISWSDNRWSYGNIYEKCGFTKDEELGPDYSYVNINLPLERISKQSCQKKKIGCPKDKTEREFMLERGFDRIWDCGKIRWSISL